MAAQKELWTSLEAQCHHLQPSPRRTGTQHLTSLRSVCSRETGLSCPPSHKRPGLIPDSHPWQSQGDHTTCSWGWGVASRTNVRRGRVLRGARYPYHRGAPSRHESPILGPEGWGSTYVLSHSPSALLWALPVPCPTLQHVTAEAVLSHLSGEGGLSVQSRRGPVAEGRSYVDQHGKTPQG